MNTPTPFRFLSPVELKEIQIRYKSGAFPLVDNLVIKDLNSNTFSSSKQRYLHYLQQHGLVPFSRRYEDLFSSHPITVAADHGGCNVFVIDIVARSQIQNSEMTRGLIVNLNFAPTFLTKWFLAVNFVYNGCLL